MLISMFPDTKMKETKKKIEILATYNINFDALKEQPMTICSVCVCACACARKKKLKNLLAKHVCIISACFWSFLFFFLLSRNVHQCIHRVRTHTRCHTIYSTKSQEKKEPFTKNFDGTKRLRHRHNLLVLLPLRRLHAKKNPKNITAFSSKFSFVLQ